MPDVISQILQTEGLIWLIVAFSLAGVIRGFTGFGTAMIVVPVGAMFLPIAEIVFILTITGLGTAATLIPKAWPVSSKREVLLLSGTAILALPLGIQLLTILDQNNLRWALTVVVGILLTSLIAGWRYSGPLSTFGIIAIGGMAGLIGGATGLTGPVVIMFYLASSQLVQVIRANSIIFLGVIDVALIVMLVARGLADWEAFYLGLFLAIPYVLTAMLGQRLFDPNKEKLYRILSYGVIIGVAVISMPIFD